MPIQTLRHPGQDVIVGGVKYYACGNFNDWDTNFHFIAPNHDDYLVDIEDVAEERGEYSLRAAIEWARELGAVPAWRVREAAA